VLVETLNLLNPIQLEDLLQNNVFSADSQGNLHSMLFVYHTAESGLNGLFSTLSLKALLAQLVL